MTGCTSTWMPASRRLSSMLTALSGEAHVRAAMDAGADDFLTKPLDRNQLQMRLAVAERLHALRARVHELEAR